MTDHAKDIRSTIVICVCLGLLGLATYLKVEGAGVALLGTVGIVVAWVQRPPPKNDPPPSAKMVPAIAVGAIVAHIIWGCSGPTPAVNVENAAAVAQYEVLLAECRAKGKAARSYEVYEACADAVDAELCRTSRVLCKDGGK